MIEGDSKGFDKVEKESLGELGYQAQEFDDESGELVTAEDEDTADDLEFDIDESFEEIID